MNYIRPFYPVRGASFAVPMTGAASTPRELPESARSVVLSNTSTETIAYVRISPNDEAEPAISASAAGGDMPVMPLSQIRITLPANRKSISIIADAGDGALIVTPGTGD